MDDCLEQPLFNAWTHGATPLAPLLDKGIASSSVHILPYIYIYISFSPISFLLIIKENPSLQGLYSHYHAFIAFVGTISFHKIVCFTW